MANQAQADQGYDAIIRSMIQHENDLINSRMVWMITLQGLLFTALGASINNLQPGANTLPLAQLIPWIGFMSSLITIWSLFMAQRAIVGLLEWWSQHEGGLMAGPTPYNGPPVIGFEYKENRPSGKILNRYITPWILFPIVFAMSWLIILASA